MSIKNIPQSLLDAVKKVLSEAHEEHPMIEVDGVMKHRHNSLGQPIHHTDEGIRNFHRWFGDSKAVDEQGRPKVFYHGTGADFSEFKTSGGHGKTFGTGTFFSDNSQIASTYAVGNMRNVIPVYLNIASPVIVDVNSKNWNSIQQKSSVQIPLKSGKSKSTTVKSLFKGEFDYPDDTVSTDDIARWTRLNGHHGLLIKNVIDHGPTRYGEEPRSPSTLIVAFHPHQIKSAIGNSGAFSHPTKITEAIDAKHHNISMSQSTGADKSKWVNFSLKDDSGKQIGSLMLSSHDAGKNYSVREANVDAAHRGLGHGKDMYLAAINFAKENNANLTSDKSISVDANKVWNSLRKMSMSVSRHPNVKFVADKLRTHRNIDIDGNSVSIPSDEPVWKYTNNQSMITESEEDYRGSHTAPGPDYGAPAHDLTRDIYPEDFYSSKGSRLYGDGRDDDYKVHSQLRTLHNRPDAEVNIYRAVPDDSKITEINPGDWVTTNLQYAHDHGERFDGHKILSKRVKAKEIFTDGNSFNEFGYHPQD